MARIWPWELATRIASGVSAIVRKVQKEKLRSAFLVVYPAAAVERPRTREARDAARAASGSSSEQDTDADTDDVTEDLGPLEELSEEEMEGPTITVGPFQR